MNTQSSMIFALAVGIAACSNDSTPTLPTTQYPTPTPPPPPTPTPTPTPAPTPTPTPTPTALQGATPTPLVTSQANPDIVNAWGLAFNGTAGPAWLADNGTGKSSVYDSTNTLRLTVTVPPAAGSAQARPTGIVFNANAQAFNGDSFIFVSEDGAVSGWQTASGTTGVIRVDNSGTQAVYTGATLATVAGVARLYAANFSAARIDAFDQTYKAMPLAAGAFTDPALPPGYAPFNVKAIGNHVLVAYALQDPTKKLDVPGAGNGLLDVYDLNGTPLARLVSNGAELDAPWGLTVTPASYGKIPNALLVGNFGDGFVNVYGLDPTGLVATFQGRLVDANQQPFAIPGLWSLEFALDAGGFSSQQLYYTAGPAGGTQGVYGRLDLLP